MRVDFERFANEYYPHFREEQKAAADAALIYSEIMTHIRGSLQALHSAEGYLSSEEYLQLGTLRHSTLGESQRVHIYDAFVKYEKMKAEVGIQRKLPDYDISEVVFSVHKALEVTPLPEDVMMTSVFVDEVQDLAPSQIALFKHCSINPVGYVFAGDTAQTVSRFVHVWYYPKVGTIILRSILLSC